MTARPRRRVHLAVQLPGADALAGWTDPRPRARVRSPAPRSSTSSPLSSTSPSPSRSPVEFAAFERLGRTAERGLFDFLLLDEGAWPCGRPDRGRDLDAVGRPEPLTTLAALTGVTERLGLAATVDARCTEPYALARALATVDHLSGGRAAWHLASSHDCLNAGDLDRRGTELQRVVTGLWDSWPPSEGAAREFTSSGRHFDGTGAFTVPRPPQGRPVLIRAGDSPEERERAAAHADVVVVRHGTLEEGRAHYADVKRRSARYGRGPDDLKVMAGVGVVLGDTAAGARERAAVGRRREVSPRHAILALERIWGTDLSSYDPDGPLPDFDPVPASGSAGESTGRGDAVALAEKWRALSREKGLSIRETVIEAGGRPSIVGTAATVAGELDRYVRQGAADGFVLLPGHAPGGLDEFVDRVVPLLQERGVFRRRYRGTTLRSHLGLPDPAGEEE
ncbi:LLM class flavin-dependent oxidoreductase [Streptomyces sp. ACT015]|uniref:LLM class flavin-dependent oxidoreductase n=1 Tax=Streptomyces sp. ACT015 TaxID=3134807 RepID=UPI003D167A59